MVDAGFLLGTTKSPTCAMTGIMRGAGARFGVRVPSVVPVLLGTYVAVVLLAGSGAA